MNNREDNHKRYSMRVVIALWGLALLAIFATLAAGRAAIEQESTLGWPAFILLIGVSIVSVLSIVTILFNRSADDLSQENDKIFFESVDESFQRLPIPSLIIKNNKPVIANKAYFNLAATLEIESIEGEPPTIDRLFSNVENNATASLFRLHHTTTIGEQNFESIRSIKQDGKCCIYNIDVLAIKDGQLWQITPENESDKDSNEFLTKAPIGLFSMRPDGTILEINTTLLGWLGSNRENAPKTVKHFIENPSSLLQPPQDIGRIIRAETRIITQKGFVSPTVMTGTWHKMDSGNSYASVALYGHSGLGAGSQGQKMSIKNEAQKNIDVFNGSPFGVVVLDTQDLTKAKINNLNIAMANMYDGADLTGKAFSDLFSDNETTRKFLTSNKRHNDKPVEVRLSDANKRPVNVYFSVSNTGETTAFVIDISTKKSLEDQLVQSQKMQAIGQLAGGVAHDFNNLLTAIRLNTDELLGRHPVGDPSYPELQKINQTVSRAAGLVRKLLAFSRKQTLRTEVLDVTDTLSDLSVLLNQVLVARVKLDVVHGRGLPPIRADKTQLETVLMNLCVNARDASVDAGGGTITLRSAKVKPADLKRDNITVPDGGGFILIEVIDTGTGMDLETQEKIFEPFFTTKEQGKGTGLGLATVYGIVEQSGGHLRLKSKLGEGTTFRIYIPTASEADIVEFKPKPKNVVVKPKNLAGQGNILFVEDEDAVRTIAAKTLRKRGYTVVEACDGEEAYEILEEATEDFDLMISDVVMPGMDGPTLLKKGRKLLGKAEIVFISGYAEEEFSELLAEEPDVTFLPKPFTLKQLAEKVKTVIGEAA